MIAREPVAEPEDVAVDLRVPPNDVTSERAIIGAVLMDGRTMPEALPAVGRVLATLDASDFYGSARAKIWRASQAAHQRGVRPECVILQAHLSDDARAEAAACAALNVSPANIEHYAHVVRENAQRRALLVAGQRLVEASYKGADLRDIEALAVDGVQLAVQTGARVGVALEGDAPTLAELARAGTFTERQWIVEPFFPVGHVGILFAGPKVGKTTLLVALIVDLLLGRHPCEGAFGTDAQMPDDFEVLYLTEDGPQLLQLVRRCAGRAADVALARIRVISPKRSAQLRDFDQVTAEVREILTQNPKIRAFATDTLGNWSRATEMGSTYDYARMTVEVVTWANLAAMFGVAGSLVHHANRQGGFLGSQAIAGCSAVNIALTRPDEAARRLRLAWSGRSDDALHYQLLAAAGLLDHPEAEAIEAGRRSTVMHLEPFAFDDPAHGLSRAYRKVVVDEPMTAAEKAKARRTLDVKAVISCLRDHPDSEMGVAKIQAALAEGAWRRICLDAEGITTVPEWYWEEGSPGKTRVEKATKAIRDDLDAHPDALTVRNRALVWSCR